MTVVSDAALPSPAIAVRTGCALAYEVAQPTSILLLIQPRPGPAQVLAEERLTCSAGSQVEHLLDTHGNLMLKALLMPGLNEFRHDAILYVSAQADNHALPTDVIPAERLPLDVLRYTFPSRYCESDKLAQFAWRTFDGIPAGAALVQAICDWTHRHIEYRYGSGDSLLSAADVIDRGYGVCRDFAHVMVALCRALDVPARYVAGHMPYRGIAEHDIGVDFHAWCEVYLGGHWHIYDPRHNKSHAGRAKIAHGMDAVDAAFATIYGHAPMVKFQVWAYQVDPALARVGDPVAIVKGDSGSAEQASDADRMPSGVMLPAPPSCPALLHG